MSLALLGHGIIRKLGARAAPADGPARPGPGHVLTSARAPATSPADWVADPLAGMGIERIERDPPEAAVPPGAIRRHGHRRLLADGPVDIITYVVECDLPTAEEFYRGKLAAAGYRLVKRADIDAAVKGGPGIILAFRDAQRRQYDVMLIPTDNDKRLEIVLVIARPGPTDRQAGRPPL